MISRDAIFEEVKRTFAERILLVHGPSGMCLYWAIIGMHVLDKYGIASIMQAGNASWPIDDGGRVRFKYEGVAGKIFTGHVWLSIPATREHVDFSIHQLKRDVQDCKILAPDYLWFSGTSPYEYAPNREAIQNAIEILKNKMSFAVRARDQ